MADIKGQAWDNFMTSVDFESDANNFKFDFKIMSKKYGNAFIEYCKCMWQASDQTEDEFCKMNANMPRGFFDKVINK